MKQRLSQSDPEFVTVTAKTAVYSGTILIVRGVPFEVKEDIRGKAKFILNTEEQVVELVT